jgi:hypothetical protein
MHLERRDEPSPSGVAVQDTARNVMYIARATVENTMAIAAQIKGLLA